MYLQISLYVQMYVDIYICVFKDLVRFLFEDIVCKMLCCAATVVFDDDCPDICKYFFVVFVFAV